jgi:SPP1 family predicted phage head-tail adaptor
MQAGKMRTPITVQTYTDSIASNGETTKTWTTFKSGMYAEIRPVSGRELIMAGKVQAELSHVIKTRFVSGILGKMRITDGTRIFEIVAAIPDRTNAKDLLIYANQKV